MAHVRDKEGRPTGAVTVTGAQAKARAYWDDERGSEARRARAAERKAFRDSISPATQVARLKKRPGESARELRRLTAAQAAAT